MAQPVKLSDTLINAARDAASDAHRSLAAQVEHWATLGRAIEGSLTSDQSASLKRSVQEPAVRAYAQAPHEDPSAVLTAALERAVSPAFAGQVRQSLTRQAGPQYGTHTAFPGYLVRYEADGTLTPGRLVDRVFIPVAP